MRLKRRSLVCSRLIMMRKFRCNSVIRSVIQNSFNGISNILLNSDSSSCSNNSIWIAGHLLLSNVHIYSSKKKRIFERKLLRILKFVDPCFNKSWNRGFNFQTNFQYIVTDFNSIHFLVFRFSECIHPSSILHDSRIENGWIKKYV